MFEKRDVGEVFGSADMAFALENTLQREDTDFLSQPVEFDCSAVLCGKGCQSVDSIDEVDERAVLESHNGLSENLGIQVFAELQ